ncbi:MAG: cache domain-containing protein [Cyclobacteriaceae bacterium]
MKLEKKVTLLMCSMLATLAILVTGTSLYFISQQTENEVHGFRTREMASLKTHLKDIVDVGYGLLQSQYEHTNDREKVIAYIRKNLVGAADSALQAADDEALMAAYGEQAKQEMLQHALKLLRESRFDDGNGYYWITDSQLPYPTMVMHAAKPQNEGKVMSAEKYNTEKHDHRNIYQARVEGCLNEGQAFIEYVIEKPETGKVEEKISYSKIFKPLGWVISSGVYTDRIEARAAAMEARYEAELRNIFLVILAVTAGLLVVTSLLTYRFAGGLAKTISQVKDRLKKLAMGEKVDKIERKATNESGETTESLNNLVEGTNSYVDFAKEIGNGNLEHSFTPLSDEDVLGNELLQMREKLQKTSEDERQRSWANQGMAMFSDILRRHQENTVELCDEVLRALAKYVNINQGGIFLTEESTDREGLQLRLTSLYAFDRKKYEERAISVGEGLAGQCYQERETILLTEIPDNYVNITSGLGEANSRNIALFPLLYNEDVHGVLEIASFTLWKDYEIELIEKLCENLASTVSTVKVNETTKALLEQSQQMADEMKSQEEELRQNQEEMQATQEEMVRNQQELTEENLNLKSELESLRSMQDIAR